MKDKELDDLFRRNADYLADELPRDFDKDAFWQQLQTELPKKADRREKRAAWWWAAASVLLVGMLGGIWWMRSAELGTKKELAGKVVKTSPKQTAEDLVPETAISISHQEDNPNPISGKQKTRKNLLAKKEIAPLPPPSLSAMEEIALQPIENSPTENPLSIKNEPALPEMVAPAIPENPVYRVVHINEIRQRKQQQAKEQSRVAFRIGLPSGSQVTTLSDNKPLLSIPIQH